MPAPTAPPVDDHQIVTVRSLMVLTTLSRSTITRLRRTGELPEPSQLSSNRIGWRRGDIAAWLLSRRRPWERRPPQP